MNIQTIIRQTGKIFPALIHWSHLSAFSAFAFCSAGIITATYLPIDYRNSSHQLYLILSGTAIGCLIPGILFRRRCFRAFFFYLAGLLLLIRMNYKEAYTLQALTQFEHLPEVSVRGTVVTSPAPRHGRIVFLLRVSSMEGDTAGIFRGKLFRVSDNNHMSSNGETLRLKCTVLAPRPPDNRYGFNERQWFRSSGITGILLVQEMLSCSPPASFFGQWTQRLRFRIDRTLHYYPKPEHRNLIRAAFLGEKSFLSGEMKELFSASGLYHLLALSGLHAGILLGAVYALFFLLPFRREIKHISALAVLWGYLLFVGPVPSLTRATVMATVVIASLVFQHKHYPLQALGIAGLVWLIISPVALYQAGFQLSFGATAGILILYPRMVKLIPDFTHPVTAYCVRLVLQLLLISVAAFCATAPVLLYHFGVVSLYGIIANIVSVPVMTVSLWLWFSALLVPDILPWVNSSLVWISGLFLDLLILIARGVRFVPWTGVALPAPFTESMIIWYAVLAAAGAAAHRYVKTVLLIGGALLFCAVPAGYLYRRWTAHPEVIRFALVKDTDITAVRRTNGRVWLFSSGDRYQTGRVIERTVKNWIHHTPGTAVEHVFIFDGEGTISDSNAVDGTMNKYTGDTLIVSGKSEGKNSVYCRGYRASDSSVQLKVTYSAACLLIDYGTDELAVNSDETPGQTVSPPFRAVLRKGNVAIEEFR
jgi:ComEC/Rec2-related protein